MDRSAGGQEDSPRGLFSVQDLQEGRAKLGRTSSLRSVSSRDDANDEVVAQNSSEHDAGRTSFARTIPLDVVQPKGTGKDLHVARSCALSADGSHAAFNCVDPGGFPCLTIFEIATKAPPVCLTVDREATWRTRDDSEQETPEETAGQTPPANRSRQKTIDRELDVESIMRELMETLNPPPAARGCSLSSSGRVAIAYGESGWIVVWRDVHHSHLNREGHPKAEVIPASVLFKEEAHSRTINYCHFTGDEKRFISCADDMTVRIWNVEGEAVQCEGVLRGHTRAVRSCSMSNDGSVVVSCTHSTTSVWPVCRQPEKLTASLPRAYRERLSMSPVNSRSRSQTWSAGKDVTGCTVSRDGSLAVSCSATGQVVVWDVSDFAGWTTEKYETQYNLWLELSDLSSEEVSRTSSVANSSRPFARRVCILHETGAESTVRCALSADASRVIAFCKHSVVVWNIGSVSCEAKLEHGHKHEVTDTGCAVDATGQRVLTCARDKSVVWNLSAGNHVEELDIPYDDVPSLVEKISGCGCNVTLDGRILLRDKDAGMYLCMLAKQDATADVERQSRHSYRADQLRKPECNAARPEDHSLKNWLELCGVQRRSTDLVEEVIKDFFKPDAANQLSTIPLFSNHPKAQLDGLAKAMRTITYKKNDYVMKQGELGNEIFICRKGRLSVYVTNKALPGGQQCVRLITPGEYFGEAGFLESCKRSASIKATTEVECSCLSKADYYTVCTSSADTDDKLAQAGIEESRKDQKVGRRKLQKYKSTSTMRIQENNVDVRDIGKVAQDLDWLQQLLEVISKKCDIIDIAVMDNIRNAALKLADNSMADCAVSGDGTRFLSSHRNGDVCLWDPKNGRQSTLPKCVLPRQDSTRGVQVAATGCCFLPSKCEDATEVLTCYEDGVVRQWRIAHDEFEHPTFTQSATNAANGESLDFWPAGHTESDVTERGGVNRRSLASCSVTQCGTRVIFSCDDNSLRICDWDPTSASHGRELVQYRRYLRKLNTVHTRNTDRIVSIGVVKADIMLKGGTKVDLANDLHTLVRFEDGTVQLVDLSYVDRGFPPASVVWENFKNIGSEDWFTWLRSIVRPSQPSAQPSAVLIPSPPGIWHQRLLDDNGGNLPYQLILDSTEVDQASRVEHLQALCVDKRARGILSVALHSNPIMMPNSLRADVTSLSIAMDHNHQAQVQAILDDYSAFIEGGQLTARDEGWMLSEASIVQLFDGFPEMAREFMSTLQLRHVPELDPSRKCTVFNVQDPDIVRDDSSPLPTHGPLLSTWWDMQLDDTIRAPDHDGGQRMKIGDSETARAMLLPIVGTRHVLDQAVISQEGATGPDTISSNSSSHKEVQPIETKVLLGHEYDKLVSSCAVESQSELLISHRSESTTEFTHPFSQLLDAAVRHTDDGASMFEGPVLQAIVKHKWEGRLWQIHKHRQMAWVAFVVAYTVVTIRLERPATIRRSEEGYAELTALWVCLVGVQVYTMVLGWQRLRDLCTRQSVDIPWGWYFDIANVFMVTLANGVSVTKIAYTDELYQLEDDWQFRSTSDAVVGMAGLSVWLKLLWYLEMVDVQNGGTIYMMVQIVKKLWQFFAMLLVMLCGFGYAFFFLLRESNIYSRDVQTSDFQSLPNSIVGTFEMLFGSFDVELFRMAPYSELVVWLFLIFMFLVVVLMMNFLIAAMSEFYSTAREHQLGAGTLARAEFILAEERRSLRPCSTEELERLEASSWCGALLNSRTFRTLAALQMPVPHSGRFLHVLQPVRTRSHKRAANDDCNDNTDHMQLQMQINELKAQTAKHQKLVTTVDDKLERLLEHLDRQAGAPT